MGGEQFGADEFACSDLIDWDRQRHRLDEQPV
jgi:hypothetical protein